MTGASDVRTPWNAPFVVRDGERVEAMIGLTVIAGWVPAEVALARPGFRTGALAGSCGGRVGTVLPEASEPAGVSCLKRGGVSAVVELLAADSSFRATASVSGATGRERSGRGVVSRVCLTGEAESVCRVSL